MIRDKKTEAIEEIIDDFVEKYDPELKGDYQWLFNEEIEYVKEFLESKKSEMKTS